MCILGKKYQILLPLHIYTGLTQCCAKRMRITYIQYEVHIIILKQQLSQAYLFHSPIVPHFSFYPFYCVSHKVEHAVYVTVCTL